MKAAKDVALGIEQYVDAVKLLQHIDQIDSSDDTGNQQ